MRAAPNVASHLAEADRGSLQFAAAHQLVDAGQVAKLVGEDTVEAHHRLDRLAQAGLIAGERTGAESRSYFRITSAGLRAIGSRLPLPGFDLRSGHALAVGWLWLSASAGRFGSVDRVLTEREMQVEDREGGPEAPFDVRPLEFGGQGEVHYPDLMLLTGSERVGVELFLTPPGPQEFAAVLRAYGADVRVVGVLVLVSDPRVGRLVQSVAAGLELTAFVHVQMARAG